MKTPKICIDTAIECEGKYYKKNDIVEVYLDIKASKPLVTGRIVGFDYNAIEVYIDVSKNGESSNARFGINDIEKIVLIERDGNSVQAYESIDTSNFGTNIMARTVLIKDNECYLPKEKLEITYKKWFKTYSCKGTLSQIYNTSTVMDTSKNFNSGEVKIAIANIKDIQK